MAKSALLNAAKAAMKALKTEVQVVDKKFEDFEDIANSDVQKLQARYDAADKAVKELATHMENLEKRENDPKVADRIKNLKNLFKNKAELASRRKNTRDKLKTMQTKLKSINGQIQDTKGIVKLISGN